MIDFVLLCVAKNVQFFYINCCKLAKRSGSDEFTALRLLIFGCNQKKRSISIRECITNKILRDIAKVLISEFLITVQAIQQMKNKKKIFNKF